MLSRVTFKREGTRVMLQQVTIEEHQVENLVFVLLQLFIHVAEGHIDLIIVQVLYREEVRMVNPNTTGVSRGVEIRGA
jgi:NADH:ubiquinone oxidoreductase subunit K